MVPVNSGPDPALRRVEDPGGDDQEQDHLGAHPVPLVEVRLRRPGQEGHDVVRHLRDLADQNGIPWQLEVLNHGGTDASLIQRLRSGVAVVTISIPARYIHTVNETVSLTDVEHTIGLLARYLEDAHTRPVWRD